MTSAKGHLPGFVTHERDAARTAALPILLVVDDEPEITASFADQFRHNYFVLTAASATEALVALQEQEVSVIVADQRMPVMTGTQLLAEVRAAYPDTVRILLTGYADIEAVIHAVNEGKIFYYIAKPWRNDELNAVIAKAFEHYQLLQDRRGFVENLSRAHAELGTYRDHLEQLVTERTRELASVNEQLKEVDLLKSMFIASMSHELRTPLNSIIGFTSIVLNEWNGPLNEEQQTDLALVLKAGQHLLFLINDIIDVSKIEAGQVDIVMDEFDIYDLCTEAAGLLAEEARVKGLLFTLEPVHHLLRTDRRRLLQCLVNLIGNAVKYTENGSVAVSATLERQGTGEPGMVVLKVADTGIGIAAEDRDKLFLPFVRLDSRLKGEVPGTGLGLYLTSRIVQMVLGGKVCFLENEAGGSIFSLLLPDHNTQGKPKTFEGRPQ